MRANVEDADLSSYKLRLATAYVRESGIQIDVEHAVLGMMVRIWYHAVNEKKKKLSLADISKYLLIVKKDTAQSLIDCLVQAEYLVHCPDENLYEVVGKDKDFAQKIENEESSRAANEAKKKKPQSSQSNSNVDNGAKKRPSTVPSAVPPAEPLAVLSTEPSAVPHYISLHNITDHSSSLQFSALQDKSKENTKNTQNELQLLPLPASPPSVVAKGSDDKKKSLDSFAKKKQEEQIYWIKSCYEQWYIKRFRVTEDKLPPWGSVERGACKRLISGTIGVDRVLELIPEYFKWQNQQVINAGYPFASGYASFCQKINELIADMANPERRQISQILAFKEKADHVELKQQNEIAEMTKMAEEYKSRQERLKML